MIYNAVSVTSTGAALLVWLTDYEADDILKKTEDEMIKAVIFDMFETLITQYNIPQYFSAQMAEDAQIDTDRFVKAWIATEDRRTVGELTVDAALEMILRDNGRYSVERLKKMMDKRIASKEECFRHMHPEIEPMFDNLRQRSLRVGLISNCFSEEAAVIRQSVLANRFDAMCLSFEMGMQKPDRDIFSRCIASLNVEADECLYVGDGGSNELEAAADFGMEVMQAGWYLYASGCLGERRKERFRLAETPFDVIRYIDGCNE